MSWGVRGIILGKFLTVECAPVVEVVEVDGIEDAAIVGEAHGGADAGASVIGVIVAGDRGVESGDGLGIQFGGIGRYPCFRLHVGGFARDEGEEGLALDANAVEHHLIIAHAAAWVIGVELASGGERSFLPEARKMQDSQRTCGAAADGGYD